MAKTNQQLLTDPSKLAIGVGVNTGKMLVGNFGGKKRFEYTVIGDNVNLAARVESLTKKYGATILITGACKRQLFREGELISNASAPQKKKLDSIATLRLVTNKCKSKLSVIQIKNHGLVILRLLDKVIVKGKTKPINIYQPVASSNLNNSHLSLKLIKTYHHAFHLYQSGQFSQAKKILNSYFASQNDLKAQQPRSDKMQIKCCQTLLQRIEVGKQKTRNGQRWNGVWIWKQK